MVSKLRALLMTLILINKYLLLTAYCLLLFLS